MNFNNPDKGGSTIVIRTMCAAVFVVFSILWLYCFQADVLAVAQHVLSGGRTHYNPLVGTVLITGVLWLLQLLVCSLTKLKKMFHALTFLPSMLLLAVLSDINSDIDLHFNIGVWWVVVPLVLVVWVLLVIAARGFQPYERGSGAFFSRRSWVNMAIMAVMMTGVVAVANTNAVFHYRARVETCLLKGDYSRALDVGSRSHETDASLTMLRIYALSKTGQLGQRLFHYPPTGGSRAMLPFGQSVRTLRFPADSIFRYLGAIPKGSLREEGSTIRYLLRLEQTGKATPAVADYILCAYLLDRDLDSFVRTLSRYYQVGTDLPRHYREALTLYTHLRAAPILSWSDSVTEEDYADLQQLEAQYPDSIERKLRVAEKYHESYWYYYEYKPDS